MSEENIVDGVKEALEAIKSDVSGKTAELSAMKDELEARLEKSADKASVAELKEYVESVEAKLDAIPMSSNEEKKMDELKNVNEAFEKSFEANGKHMLSVEFAKSQLNDVASITGAPTQTFGLTGSSFAVNPILGLASVMNTASTAIKLPVRTGSQGATEIANKNTPVAETGTSADVAEIDLLLKTFVARTDVSTETAEDIIGFDQFWAQDMIDQVNVQEAMTQAGLLAGFAASSKVAAAGASAVTDEDLASLIFSVSPQYRAQGVLMVSTDLMRTLRLMTNDTAGANHLMFDPQLAQFRLYGYPVVENAYMSSIATGNTVAGFGDWKKGYAIANRKAVTVGRMDQTVPGHYVYYADKRSGATQWDTSALKTLVMA